MRAGPGAAGLGGDRTTGPPDLAANPAPGRPWRGPGAQCRSPNRTQLRTKLEARLGGKLIFNPGRSSLFSMMDAPPPSNSSLTGNSRWPAALARSPRPSLCPAARPQPPRPVDGPGLQAVGGFAHFPWRTRTLAPRTGRPVRELRTAGGCPCSWVSQELARREEGPPHPLPTRPWDQGVGADPGCSEVLQETPGPGRRGGREWGGA